MMRKLKTAEEVHGKTGLDGVDLPEPSLGVDPRHAVGFIIEACRSAPEGGLTLCPIGPLTNIALALIMAPDICSQIRELVLMGGSALGPGNVTAAAEFNIYVDPHAAKVVFDSGIHLTMLGLDVTHKAIATPARRAAIEAVDTPAAKAVGKILAYYDRCDVERYGAPGAPLHDPCVIAYILCPELFEGRECHVAVETAEGVALGRTVTDWWGKSDKPANCHVITEIDADGFFDLLTKYLGKV
jgi:purine nucleosidase